MFLLRIIAVLIVAEPLIAQSGSSEQHSSIADRGRHENSGPELLTSFLPHPYLSFGPALMPTGYAPLAYRIEGGIDMESTYVYVPASVAFDNGRERNDDDQPNLKGHDRYLNAAVYGRPFGQSGKWFFGAGWRWNQLSTTNYVKSVTRPQIGGGYDWFRRRCSRCEGYLSMHINADWVMSGNDWQNGTHGPEITISFPSPRLPHHWFWQQRVDIFRTHETVTERSNVPLTREQRSNRYFSSSVNVAVSYRF